MSDAANRRRQPSRLQRRAPATLQVNRSTEWNVAIPLLSPCGSSPPSINRTGEIAGAPQTTSSGTRQDGGKPGGGVTTSFKKWQAAPFCYQGGAPASLANSYR